MIIEKIWPLNNNEYDRNRIPGIFVTSKQTIIIYNEARRTLSDWANMDIFIQRSNDFGKTFSNPTYITKGTDEINTKNNPVILEDKNGVLHFLYCENYGINNARILHKTSCDDGITWSIDEDITYATKPEIRNAFAFGPGHGICTKDGVLMVPVWYVKKDACAKIESHVPSVIAIFYSNDNGKTWNLSDEIPFDSEFTPSPSETAVAETSDGKFYLNARNNFKNGGFRSVSYSDDGIHNYKKLKLDKNLVDPTCFGSLAYGKFNGKHIILFVNCDNKTQRNHVTLKLSLDDGKSFEKSILIDENNGGYADVAFDAQTGNIYVLYELDYGKSVNMAIVNISEFNL